MKSSEIPFSELLHTYGKYWWCVVVVFVIAAILGDLVPDGLRANVTRAEFTLPVVVREQPITNWKEEDTYALIGFVNAWLNSEWKEIVVDNYPNAHSYVLLENETFHFLIEHDDASVDPVAVQQFADELYEAFVSEFIVDSQILSLDMIEGEACLTNSVLSSMVECVPVTTGIETAMLDETFNLGNFLWVGELSEVQVENQFPYLHFVQAVAAGISAVIVMMLVVLIDLTRKSLKEA